jgi:hypothetical protein
LLTINSTTVATPSVFQVDISDIDGETTRNAKGDLIRDRIAVKRKLTCEWKALTQAQVSAILSAVSGVFFTVQYPDPVNGVVTITCYVGDRSTPMYRNINGTILWEGLKLNLVQK